MNYLTDTHMDEDIVLRVNHVTVWEKKKEVLTKFDLTLKKGEIHAVIGRFYTDIKAVWDIFSMTDYVETDGPVFLCGKKLGEDAFVQNKICTIHNGSTLIRGFTVLDNMFLKEKHYYYFSKHPYRKKLKTVLERFEMVISPSSDIAELTIGERILLEFVRAYLDKPKFCLLNDCLNLLSERQQKIVLQMIHVMQEESGTAVLFLSTRYEDVLKLADKITVISNCTVNGQFDIREVQKNPQKLIYRISGWNTTDADGENGFRDIMALLLEEQHAIESTEEIKGMLEILIGSMRDVTGGQFCSVVLIDEQLQNYIVAGDQGPIIDVILELMKTRGSLLLNQVIDVDMADQNLNPDRYQNLRHVFYSSVRLEGEMSALLIEGFENLQKQVMKKKQILYNFAKEISIMMETSRMVGKSVLLQESHHRIKNNLQIIVNLLYMQKISLIHGGGDVKEAFDKVINQVKSIAVIHDLLSKEDRSKNMVNLKEIVREVAGFYQFGSVQFILKLEDAMIPYNNAATISLLINELISNCIKHAFPTEHELEKKIEIICCLTEAQLKIRVADNGVGFPEDMKLRKKGIGTNIITSTVQKMNGKLIQENIDGAVTTILLHKNSIYE